MFSYPAAKSGNLRATVLLDTNTAAGAMAAALYSGFDYYYSGIYTVRKR
jgi:hypothetical protein